MKHQKTCDKCDRPATNISVEIIKGEKIRKNLCDLHAAEDGIPGKAAQHTPINELLTKFVQAHSGAEEPPELQCGHCNMSFNQFRQHSILGCPVCYEAFEAPLSALLERAHEGGTHHVGKVPRRVGASEQRQQQVLRMRKRLGEAVEAEDYELAARLRDDIQRYEENTE